jgi:hypothetical protein
MGVDGVGAGAAGVDGDGAGGAGVDGDGVMRARIELDAFKRVLECGLACCDVGFYESITVCVSVTVCFWSLFVFDMIADVFGDAMGGVGVCVLLLCAVLCVGITRVIYPGVSVSQPPGRSEDEVYIERMSTASLGGSVRLSVLNPVQFNEDF